MIVIDARYVVLAGVLCGAWILILRRPQWVNAVTVALASTALAYSILFLR